MNWAYIAGFTDGEGHLGIQDYDNIKYGGRSKGKRGVIQIGQAVFQNKVIYDISDFLHDNGISHHIYTTKPKPDSGQCAMTSLRIGAKRDMAKFLKPTLEYLIVKQDIAKKLYDFCFTGKQASKLK